jgi:2-isopropylmalate synthase
MKLGVDIIEAGFPIASKGDFEAVQKIANMAKGVQIAGLARANFEDIDTAWDAIKNAENPRIHTFISSSDIHIEYQLKKTRDQVLEQAIEAVKRAKKYTANIEFSPMDATRSDRQLNPSSKQAPPPSTSRIRSDIRFPRNFTI